MQLRLSRTTRNGRTYEYAQLVESYRRESDGMPMHRVVASLGALSPLEIENLRTTLRASREKKRVDVAMPAELASALKPDANLDYLNLAVLLEVWSGWGLSGLLDELIPRGAQECPPSSILASLTLQRCVAPGSKLKAVQWFPQTSLPELLGLQLPRFNNTRVHRVLEDLDAITPSLMKRLPPVYREREGAFVSLFLDVTDTWFVGDGPEMACNGKTKEGFVRKKIGIVLLCDQRGLPIRWEVIPGNTADCRAMTATMLAIAGMDWVGQAPVVVDRAMGRSAQIRDMARTRLRFLTALTVAEFSGYSDRIPSVPLASFEPVDDSQGAHQRFASELSDWALSAGMTKVSDDLFVLDLGTAPIPDEEASSSTGGRKPRLGAASLAQVMKLSRSIGRAVEAGEAESYTAAALAHGIRKALGHKYGSLRTLPEDVQEAILAGSVDGRTLSELTAIAKVKGADAQRAAFAKLLERASPGTAGSPPAATTASQPLPKSEPQRVRVVAYFNPSRFLNQRQTARDLLERIARFVADLNTRASKPRSRLTPDRMRSALDRELRMHDVIDAYAITLASDEVAGQVRHRIAATLRQQEWERRRRHDGLCVLVCHEELQTPPAELCRLYRAKDPVVKDFHDIKSLIEMRPVRHHTDAKVRAHVTICMLALLLKRTLALRLADLSPDRALELLSGCHLNWYLTEGRSRYVLTKLNQTQRAILRALRMEHLGDDEKVAARVTPR